jgi:hypothetical protein
MAIGMSLQKMCIGFVTGHTALVCRRHDLIARYIEIDGVFSHGKIAVRGKIAR